jgi:hypothetical protein
MPHDWPAPFPLAGSFTAASGEHVVHTSIEGSGTALPTLCTCGPLVSENKGEGSIAHIQERAVGEPCRCCLWALWIGRPRYLAGGLAEPVGMWCQLGCLLGWLPLPFFPNTSFPILHPRARVPPLLSLSSLIWTKISKRGWEPFVGVHERLKIHLLPSSPSLSLVLICERGWET